MKTLKIILALIILSTTIFANEASDKCDQRKGSWEWDGSANQWQCIGGEEIAVIVPAIVETNTTDVNITETNATKLVSTHTTGEGFTAKKALLYAAMPVIIAGAVVTAVVVAPIYLLKKLFQ